MTEVKIIQSVENIPHALPLGLLGNQSHVFPQLVNSISGEVIPDGVYNLSQNEMTRICSVNAGKVRGVEWVDHTRPLVLVDPA